MAEHPEKLTKLQDTVDDEHRELLGCLRGLETMLEASPPTQGDLERRLTSVADTLEQHVRAEEASDLYGWLPNEVAGVRAELRELRAQHAALVDELRDLAKQVPGSETLDLNSDLSVKIRKVVADIRLHEARESSVVQRAGRPEENPAAPVTFEPYRLVRRLIVAVSGLTLVVVGLAMVVLPGPAVVVIPGGLAVLALEFEWARRLLRRVRQQLSWSA